jgi:DNA uptake protein ComE-like DNA-binding protein
VIGLTPDIAAAIVDWRDADSTVTPLGAESPYYASLPVPSRPRNASFPTIRELLMVRGVTRELLFGEEQVSTGRGPERALPSGQAADTGMSDSDPEPENGWAQWLTTASAVSDVDATGAERIHLQNAELSSLTGVQGITPEIARAIIAYRGQNRFQSVVNLLDVTAPSNPGPGNSPQRPNPNGNPANNGNGPTVINETLFRQVADRFTVADGGELTGVVNVNSASVEVLQCLPGLSRPLAQAIVAQRRSQGYFSSIAALLDVPGLSRDILKQLAPRVTTRSETYRIRSEGRSGGTGARQRVEVVVRVGLRRVTTLSYREDDL